MGTGPVRASEGTGAQESAAVLAAVSVVIGREVSSTWSRFDSVREVLGALLSTAGAAGGSCAEMGGSMGSTSGAGSGALGSSTGSASTDGSGSRVSAGFWAGASFGLGATLGAVACRSMLAQVLAAGAAALGASDVTASCSAAVVLEDLFESATSFFFCASQAVDSSVGTDRFVVSFRAPFVAGCAVRARARPPLSVPRPRPRPLSDTFRPPREGLLLPVWASMG